MSRLDTKLMEVGAPHPGSSAQTLGTDLRRLLRKPCRRLSPFVALIRNPQAPTGQSETRAEGYKTSHNFPLQKDPTPYSLDVARLDSAVIGRLCQTPYDRTPPA